MSHYEHAKKQIDNIQDYAQDVADATQDFVCEVWNDYPDYITQNAFLSISGVKGFMTNFCAPDNPPEPAIPPECEPLFHVYGTFMSKNSSAGGCDVEAYWRTKSPIAIPANFTPAPDVNAVGVWRIVTFDQQEALIGLITQADFDNNSFAAMGTGNLVRFRDEMDGCLNLTQPAYGYDVSVSKEVQATEISAECEEQINYPVTTPPPVIKKTVIIGTQVSQSQTIEIVNNTADNSFSFPITVNIGGQLNVTVDMGGFTFDNGGGNPEGQGGNGENTDIPDVITPTPPVDVDTTSKQPFVPDDFVEVKPTDNPETPGVEDEEVEEIEVEDTLVRWVLVEVTTLPYQGKTILQTNSANNDYFAGYFHWEVTTPTGKWKLPALPIRKERNAFLAPTEAIGYSAYAINGAKIKLTQYNQKIEGE